MLSSELGFSPEDRNLNVERIGSVLQPHQLVSHFKLSAAHSFVSSEIVRAGGVAIAAPTAPFSSSRRAAREMVEKVPLELQTTNPTLVAVWRLH